MTFWNNGLNRKPIGAAAKARSTAEADQARTFEGLLQKHRLDFWHCNVAQRSQPGYPDYNIFGDGWIAWVELKARSTLTGRMGVLDDGQRRYLASIERGGGEWRAWKLPDDWYEVYAWLNAHTGREIWEPGLKPRGSVTAP